MQRAQSHPVLYLFCILMASGLFLLSHPGQGRASPFCVGGAGSMPLQCYYEDVAQCKKDAQLQRGYCTVNIKEVQNLPRYGKICLIDNSRTISCPYQDFATCNLDASRNKGVCFYKPSAQDPNKPIPTATNPDMPVDPTLTDLTRSGLMQQGR